MGRPIVLLHGALGSARDWDLVATRLRELGHEVIALDAPGHGAKPWAPGLDWSPRAQAGDVPLPAGGAHLVGHSRGATAASWLAVEQPERVLSLAVVASPPEATEAFRARYRRSEGSDRRSREAYAYLARIPEEDFPTHALRRYRGPALVVEAGDDPLYSPTHTLFWRAYLPYAAFERVEGGHAFFVREPGASWLADRIDRHVTEAERA